jgi:uncharacterized protein YjlB
MPQPNFTNILKTPRFQATKLADDGTIPNNADLPLLVYEDALKLPPDDPAGMIEALLATNHWNGSWRNGIYPYHHYHSTAHEVLVVFAGSATVQLGGERGIRQTIQPGDVIILPAGVGHKNLGHSADFAIVGAYPEGQRWDMCYGRPGERPEANQNISRVALPRCDPIFGVKGPLMDQWGLALRGV